MERVLVALIPLFFAMSAQAQAPSQTGDEPIDEIVVQGKLRGGDRAMSAFFNGDYETAEIEFERNIRIIKRGRTEIEAAGVTAETQTLAEIGGEVVTAGSRSTAGRVQSAPDVSVAPHGVRSNRADGVVMSGNDMGFQYYMVGLSELQQGKVDEAESSFKSAVRRNDTLYDARMRLALIRLGKGDVEFAREQHQRLYREAERCKGRCPRPDELEEAELTLRNILAQVR